MSIFLAEVIINLFLNKPNYMYFFGNASIILKGYLDFLLNFSNKQMPSILHVFMLFCFLIVCRSVSFVEFGIAHMPT